MVLFIEKNLPTIVKAQKEQYQDSPSALSLSTPLGHASSNQFLKKLSIVGG
jgi:hypothetical protein